MQIRKRGSMYQADYIGQDGRRVRLSFTTKKQAVEHMAMATGKVFDARKKSKLVGGKRSHASLPHSPKKQSPKSGRTKLQLAARLLESVAR